VFGCSGVLQEHRRYDAGNPTLVFQRLKPVCISFAKIRLAVSRNVKESHIQGKGLTICRCGITVDEAEKSFRANISSANVKRKSSNTSPMSLVTHKVSARPALSPTERG